MVVWNNMHWSSDWNGYEVGYPDVPVVGLYRDTEETNHYIDIEKNEILESWKDDDEDDFATC